jgi:ferritin-like protein
VASESYHEPVGLLGADVVDRHRAIQSIMEELEAVDWYDQRVAATADEGLAEVLAHNRDEEKEHAAMTIEWLRRNDPAFDGFLRTYLFTDGSIVGIEHVAEHGGGGDADAEGGADADRSTGAPDGSLAIGSLREGS